MIVQDIYLPEYDWHCKVFYSVTTYWVEDILNELKRIGCSGEKYKRAKENLVMRAAFYECECTPPLGGFMWGHYTDIRAKEVIDRLYIKAGVFGIATVKILGIRAFFIKNRIFFAPVSSHSKWILSVYGTTRQI